MRDILCNSYVTFAIFCDIERKKNRKGANMIAFHLSMSHVTRSKQKNWHENDGFEEIEPCLHKSRKRANLPERGQKILFILYTLF